MLLMFTRIGFVKAQQAASSPHTRQQQATPLLQGYDASARSTAIIAHLNAVIRYYHDVEAPIQKIGEPSDLIYRNRAVTSATQAAQYAFQSAKAEALLVAQTGQQPAPTAGSQTIRLEEARTQAEQRVAALKMQDSSLSKQLGTASSRKRSALAQQLAQVQGELELQSAIADALGRIVSAVGTSNNSSLSTQITQLGNANPGIASNRATVVAPTLQSLDTIRSAGLISEARVVIELLNARSAINRLYAESAHLQKQAITLRTPLIALLKNTISEGQALSQTTNTEGSNQNAPNKTLAPHTPASIAPQPALTLDQFKTLTAAFKSLSGATVPLSQEVITLEQNQANLQAWSAAVDQEYDSLFHSILVRLFLIAIALLLIFFFSEVWRRATRRYVRDMRRRRQLLIIRRLVTGFLIGLVIILGFVTQFSSLATFAGLITAGIAVGLQTILLSVAAYFFIIGRYGIKVGDRITIAGVTGDVLEVGLVRFYMMEMAGNANELYATGRVVVFSNAVLFQAALPLYKQMPGTEYLWHELTIQLNSNTEYRIATQRILAIVQSVYDSYRSRIEQQHKDLESWVDSSLDIPQLQSNLQLADSGLQFCVRFPVMIRQAAAIDEKITTSILQLIADDPEAKAAVASQPSIKATIKG
jgi:small-conductance mechanosensitive channel